VIYAPGAGAWDTLTQIWIKNLITYGCIDYTNVVKGFLKTMVRH
jgi:hypothetical protein